MSIEVLVKRDPGRYVVLPVDVSGLVVTIAGGNFRIGKDNYVLPENFTHTVTPSEKRQWALYYFMKSKKDGSVVVMVDEVGEGETPININKDPDYTYLWNLASLEVPAGVKDLKDAKMTVIHCDYGTRGKA